MRTASRAAARFGTRSIQRLPQAVDFWDVQTGQRRCQFKDAGIQVLAVSPDGTTLVTAYPRLAGSVPPAGDKGIGLVRGFAGEQGTALAVHRFPENLEQLSDEILEKRRERRRKFLNGPGGSKGGNGKE